MEQEELSWPQVALYCHLAEHKMSFVIINFDKDELNSTENVKIFN